MSEKIHMCTYIHTHICMYTHKYSYMCSFFRCTQDFILNQAGLRLHFLAEDVLELLIFLPPNVPLHLVFCGAEHWTQVSMLDKSSTNWPVFCVPHPVHQKTRLGPNRWKALKCAERWLKFTHLPFRISVLHYRHLCPVRKTTVVRVCSASSSTLANAWYPLHPPG